MFKWVGKLVAEHETRQEEVRQARLKAEKQARAEEQAQRDTIRSDVRAAVGAWIASRSGQYGVDLTESELVEKTIDESRWRESLREEICERLRACDHIASNAIGAFTVTEMFKDIDRQGILGDVNRAAKKMLEGQQT